MAPADFVVTNVALDKCLTRTTGIEQNMFNTYCDVRNFPYITACFN